MHDTAIEPSRNPSGADFSDRDIPVSKILVFGLFVTLFTVASFVGLRHLYLLFEREANRADEAVSSFIREARVLPPEPRLQVDEPSTWAAELARQRASIEGYGWLDVQAGIVRIPVSRAMELIAERGLPARTEASAP
jgi:hypothetical protein